MKKYVKPEIELKEYRLSEAIATCSLLKGDCKGTAGNQENKCSEPGNGSGGDEYESL